MNKAILPVIITLTLLSACRGSPLSETASPTTAPPTGTASPSSAPTLAPPSPTVPIPTASPTTPPPTNTPNLLDLPLSYVSQDRLFSYLESLTNLQPYSGWRNSATEGEAEALDFVADTLEGFAYLQSLGMELERQSFHVFLATEIWESRLFLTIDGQEVEVPANALSGHRKEIKQALRFDSDGMLNDLDRNPVEVSGKTLLLRSVNDIQNLAPEDARGKIVFLDFSVIDPAVLNEDSRARHITALIEKGAASLVLVTVRGHSKGATDGTILGEITTDAAIPVLSVRLQDLAPAGFSSWEALSQIEAAHLIWDTDVFSPGNSGNLVARIPGEDSSRAVILGAHIDSANSPGAGDNALNCAVLLETARVLDEWADQPPVDIYLVWFGSHELGFYGSQHFVNTHQELLDRALGAFLMDGFTADEPGATIFAMQESSHSRFGSPRLPFAEYLEQKAQDYQIPIEFVVDSGFFASDDGPFYGFVPHVRFAFGSNKIGKGFHSPDDTFENMQDQGDVMEQSVSMALIAAVGTPQDAPDLRVTPEPQRRALIIATHTEVLHMTATMLMNLDRALAWQGFDVDVIPYGQSLTSDDLNGADLVLVLPVIDYPTAESDLDLYDEQWSADEIDLLVEYVEGGGFLVLTNSAHRLFMGEVSDPNEDTHKINALASSFGISYGSVPIPNIIAQVTNAHPLTENLTSLSLIANNGLPISMQEAETLAEVQGQVALGMLDYGGAGGQVLVLSDLGLLKLFDRGEDENVSITFLLNLALYAANRSN